MLLGVVIHAAQVYGTGASAVHEPPGGVAYDWVMAGIHSFRMHAFFWIAGFIAAMGLRRRSPAAYVSRRWHRLCVPLIATLLTFNVLVWFVTSALPAVNTSRHGFALGHLWFLCDLLVLTFVAAACLGENGIVSRCAARFAGCARSPSKLVAALACATALPMIALAAFQQRMGIQWSMAFDTIALDRWVQYFPYFLFGLVAYYAPAVRATLLRVPPAMLVVSIPAGAWLAMRGENVLGSWSAVCLISAVTTWLSVAAILAVFTRCFRQPSSVSRWFGAVSYPVYLAHHAFVVVFAALLLPVEWPSLAKFSIVVLLTAVSSLAFADTVRRVPLLSRLYGGPVVRDPAGESSVRAGVRHRPGGPVAAEPRP